MDISWMDISGWVNNYYDFLRYSVISICLELIKKNKKILTRVTIVLGGVYENLIIKLEHFFFFKCFFLLNLFLWETYAVECRIFMHNCL